MRRGHEQDEVDVIRVGLRRDEAAVDEDDDDHSTRLDLAEELFEPAPQLRTAIAGLKTAEASLDFRESAIVNAFGQQTVLVECVLLRQFTSCGS